MFKIQEKKLILVFKIQMQVLRLASKLKSLLEKYRITFQESQVIIGIIINLESQIAATASYRNSSQPSWMIGFYNLPDAIIKKQLKDRDLELRRLSDSIATFDQIHKSLNALLRDALAKTEIQNSLKSISPLEILQWIEDSFYSISKEIQVQKRIFNDYVMGVLSVNVLAERWDDCTFVDFRIEQELKKRLKYLK